MEEEKNNRIQDEMLGHVNGGNDAQYAEILEYIGKRSPAAYAEIQTKEGMWKVMYIVRYLYDHGIPVVMTSDFGGENVYVLGTLDLEKRNILETRGDLSHAELMALIRQTLG